MGGTPTLGCRRPPAAPNDDFTINDGFTTKTYNHLGNPANGILTAEAWSETGWDVGDDFAPTNTQGVVRALKQSKVLRVAVRVELWGIHDGTSYSPAPAP